MAFGFFVIVFTALAGMFSVAMTDVVCGGVMAVGLLVALALLVGDAREAPVSLPDDMRSLTGGKGGIFWLGVMLPAFLLILGDANLYQRFLSARTPATARRSAIGMFCGVMLVDWTIIGVALLDGLMLAAPPENPAHVIVDVAFELMPAGIGVLIAAAGFAVIISTADSYLLASATSAAGDLVERLRRPRWQRVLVVGLGLTALGLAFTTDEFFSVALYAYTLYGASLTPAVLLALLRPATAPAVVIAGMAAGLGAALLWKALLWRELLGGPLSELEPVIPALAANVLAMGIAALGVARSTKSAAGG